jgi:hypothetical protein
MLPTETCWRFAAVAFQESPDQILDNPWRSNASSPAQWLRGRPQDSGVVWRLPGGANQFTGGSCPAESQRLFTAHCFANKGAENGSAPVQNP